MARLYDNDKKQIVIADSGGISVPGTAASDTELVRIPIDQKIKVTSARLVAMTGGTAAGPTVQIGKSAAGTGTVVSIDQQAIGTAADNASFDLAPTVTDFDEGDHLVISNVAGTSASTPKVNVVISYVEDYD